MTSEAEGDGLIPLASVPLVIEVADTTLQKDLTEKAALYAKGAIPEYWVVDVQARAIHRLWTPDGTYQQRDVIAFGTPITSVTIDGLAVDTTGL